MSKLIPLTQGKFAIVDDEDFEELSKFKWHFISAGYVCSSTTRRVGIFKSSYLHRFIMRPELGLQVDHINGNKLDNRRSNLRICTQSQNNMNQFVRANSSTGIKGVFFHKASGKFLSQIAKDGKRTYLGIFKTAEIAGATYAAAAKKMHVEFARI